MSNWLGNCNLTFALMKAQEVAGVCVDVDKLHATYEQACMELEKLEEKVNPHLPMRDIPESKKKPPPKIQFKKDGTLNSYTVKYFKDQEVRGEPGNYSVVYPDGSLERLPTTKHLHTKEPMSIANDQDIKKWLMAEWGWRPLFWNRSDVTGERTSPKFHQMGTLCPDLERIKWPYIKDLIQYLSLKNRKNIMHSPATATKKNATGWLADTRLLSEGRLSAGAGGITNTHRMKHRKVVNLPGVGALMGQAIRSCFISSPGNVLVGYDASALENRNKGHLTYEYDDGGYAKKILDPEFDPHIESAWAWFPDLAASDLEMARDEAKPGNYALPYGCSYRKLASMQGCTLEEAQDRYDAYWENNKPVQIRAQALKKQWKKNGSYILGIDGRPFHIRSEHKLFNTECQGLGSIIMDLAGILMYRWADRVDLHSGTYWFKGKKAKRVLFMHDEYLWDCDPDIADYVLELGLKSIKEAGIMLKMNVPLEAKGHIGLDYSQVH